MNGLVKRSDVIETANKFSFTDENDRRRYLDFLDYCLKETKTAYDVDAVVEELRSDRKHFENATAGYGAGATDAFDVAIMTIRKGGVSNENNN